MSEFLEIVFPLMKEFVSYSLSKSDSQKIKDRVISSLQLKNINELRDRHEGVAFLNNVTKRIAVLLLLSKKLNLKLIDLNQFNPKQLKDTVLIKDVYYEIVIFQFGNMPTINIPVANPKILIMQKDEMTFFLCGVLEPKLVTTISSKNNNIKFTFTDFNSLQSFQEIL